MLKNTLIYTSSSIISSAIPFMLLPILTRFLSPEEYGQIAMFNILASALAAIVGLSVHGAANRRFFDENMTPSKLACFNGNCVFILLGSTTIVLFFLFVFQNPLVNFLEIPIEWIYLCITSVFFSFILNLRLGQWQVRGNAKSFGILQVLNSAINFTLSLMLVVLFHLGPEGRIFATVVTSLAIGIISLVTLKQSELLLFKLNKSDIVSALKFGVPLMPHVLGGFLLLSVDRLVINKELGLEVTGIYMVAVSLGTALNIIFSSINRAYTPWLFQKLKEDNPQVKVQIVKNTYLYFFFLIGMSIISFYFSPPILKLIVGPSFYEAAEVLPIIIIGQVFLGMYFMVTNYIFYDKRTKFLSYITVTSGMLNITLLLTLIPIYGIKGAAIAFTAANFWQFIITWIVSARVHPMPWAIWRIE